MAYIQELKANDQASPKIKKFGKAMGDAGKQADTFGAVLKANLSSAAILGGLQAMANGVKTLVSFGQDVIEMGDKFDKMSKRIGISTETLSGLSHVASLAGSDIDTLEKGILKLSRGMNEAADGQKEYKDTFDTLGLEVTDSEGKLRDLKDVLPEIADKMQALDNNTQKVALVQELFGKSGAQLIPLLDQGSEAIKNQWQEAQKLGIVLSKEQAEGAAKAKDAQQRLNMAMEGIKLEVFLPLMESFAGLLDRLAFGTSKNSRAFDILTFSLGGSIELLGDFLELVGLLAPANQATAEEMAEARKQMEADTNAVADNIIKRQGHIDALTEQAKTDKQAYSTLMLLNSAQEESRARLSELRKEEESEEKVTARAVLMRQQRIEQMKELREQARLNLETSREGLNTLNQQNEGTKKQIDLTDNFIMSKQQQQEFLTSIKEQEQIDAEAEALNRELKIEMLDDELAREREIIINDYFEKEEKYKRHTETMALIEKKANKELQEIEKRRLDQQKAIQKERLKMQLDFASVFVGSIGTIAEAVSASAAEKGRIAQLEAVVNTAKAVTSALAQFPIPLNYAAATLVGLKGAAQVHIIEKNIKYHDGGQVPGFGGEVPAVLEKGEAVIDKDTTKRAGGFQGLIDKVNASMESGGTGRRVLELNFNGNVYGTKEFLRDEVIPGIMAEIERN